MIFNWFRKKDNYSKNTNNILIKICRSLPQAFQFLYKQMAEGIVVSVQKQATQYKFVLDTDCLNKYEDKKGRYFSINNIRIICDNENEGIFNLRVGYGIALGYSINKNDILNFPVDRIKVDTSHILIQYYDENPSYKKFFTKEELQYIAPNDIYEIELKGNKYYHIKDTEDGDFIAVDLDKKVYQITHAPFEIKWLSDNLLAFLKIR